jgi:hypothetical protein
MRKAIQENNSTRSRGKPATQRLPASDGDAAFYQRIRELIIASRQRIAHGIDLVQVWTNFEIGRHIVEYEQRGATRAGYGKEVVKNLTERLTIEFGQGFSLSNLKLMRLFFLQFHDRSNQIGQTESGLSEKPKSQTASSRLPRHVELSFQPMVEITLPEDANIHAREYRLYLPSKEELRQKLEEWAGEVGDA